MGVECFVVGCSSNSESLVKWENEHCKSHKRKHKFCSCLPPFKMFPFPDKHTEPYIRSKWLNLIQRIDPADPSKWKEPNKKDQVCSKHFVFGSPTEDNPCPEIFPEVSSKMETNEKKRINILDLIEKTLHNSLDEITSCGKGRSGKKNFQSDTRVSDRAMEIVYEIIETRRFSSQLWNDRFPNKQFINNTWILPVEFLSPFDDDDDELEQFVKIFLDSAVMCKEPNSSPYKSAAKKRRRPSPEPPAEDSDNDYNPYDSDDSFAGKPKQKKRASPNFPLKTVKHTVVTPKATSESKQLTPVDTPAIEKSTEEQEDGEFDENLKGGKVLIEDNTALKSVTMEMVKLSNKQSLALVQEVDSKQRKVYTFGNVFCALLGTIDKLAKENEQLQKAVDSKGIVDINNDCLQLKSELKSLEASYKKLHAEHEAMKQELSAAEQITDINQELGNVKAALAAQTNEVTKLQQEKAELQALVASLQGTTCDVSVKPETNEESSQDQSFAIVSNSDDAIDAEVAEMLGTGGAEDVIAHVGDYDNIVSSTDSSEDILAQIEAAQ